MNTFNFERTEDLVTLIQGDRHCTLPLKSWEGILELLKLCSKREVEAITGRFKPFQVEFALNSLTFKSNSIENFQDIRVNISEEELLDTWCNLKSEWEKECRGNAIAQGAPNKPYKLTLLPDNRIEIDVYGEGKWSESAELFKELAFLASLRSFVDHGFHNGYYPVYMAKGNGRTLTFCLYSPYRERPDLWLTLINSEKLAFSQDVKDCIRSRCLE